MNIAKIQPIFFLSRQVKFILPFFIWLYLFRNFLSGQPVLIDDAFSFYANTKFFLDNLREGVYPLWNPFVLWGIPTDINLHQIGELNPIIYIILIVNLMGIHFYWAFVSVITGYFFLGVIGFYRLAKVILKDKRAAYLAFLAMLFSSLGFGIFNQTFMVFLWVPAVYFFYFLSRFFETDQKKYFAAMTAMLVVIVTTYLPFYFFTVFLFVFVLGLVFYPGAVIARLSRLSRFVSTHRSLAVLSFGIIGLSLFFPLTAYQSIRQGDVAVHTRHQTAEETHQQGAAMGYKELSGGISDKMVLREFWDNLDEVFFTRDGFIYVPVFLFFVIILTAFKRLTRLGVFLASLWFSLFLLSLGDVAGLHQFLYKKIFYFRLFRNLYFFTPFLVILFILYAAENLRVYLLTREPRDRRIPWDILVGGGIIVGLLIFLRGQYHIIGTTYVVAVLSVMFFIVARPVARRKKEKYGMIILLLVVLIQPIEVLGNYARNALEYSFPVIESAMSEDYRALGFSFVRPEPQNWRAREGQTTIRPEHEFNHYLLARRDSPGLFAIKYGFPTKWSYDFAKNLPEELYRNYTKNKLMLYDAVQEKADVPYEAFKDILLGKSNRAVVSVDKNSPSPMNNPDGGGAIESTAPVIIGADSPWVKVLKFNVNSLVLNVNLPQKNFLVYNDSYHRYWQAYYNGQKIPCYRANLAFKGVWVPAGEGVVSFQYSPPGGVSGYVGIILLFWIYLAYTAYLFVVSRREVGGVVA